MANQQFCLRWNNYQSNLTQVFDQLLQTESFVDVTLACEGQSLKAHRMVLSACSPYFQELLSDAPCSHPCIILQGVKWTELKAVVEFMYKGEININQDDLGSLLRVAEYLKIRGLAEVDGDPAETAVLTSPSISPATRALANALIDENHAVSSVLAAARKRRRLSGGEELISRPGSPLTPTSAPEIFEHALDLPNLHPHIRGGGSAPLPGSPAHFNSLSSPHLPGHMPPPPQLPPHLPHLPHLPPLSPLLNMHSLSRPHLHDDFEIRPGIAEMIREEERRRRDAPDMAKLLESSHHWMGTSMADSYQAQVQAAWQKSWNQTQSLLQNLRFRERGPLKSWRPETMAEAIHAVLKEGLSLSQAARKYDIPYPTFVLYANRVHNLLGPSQEPGDLRPKGRGRPQRILLGSWPEEQIKGVIRAVVFRDTSVFKENEHKVGARTKVSTENKHPAAPKLNREDPSILAMRPNGPALPNISGALPLFPPGTPDNGSFSTASTTPAPNTPAPNTPAPSTPASNTPAPGTPAPTTPVPSTSLPNTQAPSLSAPNTPAPITSGPNTPPSIPAPLTPSSAAPVTSASTLSLSAPSTPVPIPSTTPSAITSVAQPLTTPPTPGSTPISAAASPAGSPASNDSRITSNAAIGSMSPTSSNNMGITNPSAQTTVSGSKLSPVFSLGNTSNSNGSVASNGTPTDPSASPLGHQNQAQTAQQQQQQHQQGKPKHHPQQQQESLQQRVQQPHLQHQQHQYALQQQMQYQSQQPKAPHLHQQSTRVPQQSPHLQMQQQQQQLQQLSHQQHQQIHHQQQQQPQHQKQAQPRQQLPSQHAQQRHSHSSQNHQRHPQVPQIGGLLPTGIPPSLATSLNSQVHLARLFSESTAAAPHPFAGHQSQHPQAPISPFHPGFPRHPHPSAAMQVLNAMNNMNPHASRMTSEEAEPSPEALLFSKITNSHLNPPHSSGEASARPGAAHSQYENHGDSSSSLSGLVERASMMYHDGLDSIKSEPEPILN